MYKRPDRRKEASRLAATYAVMTLAVLGIVSVMVLFVMGYRFDTGEQRFEQTGLIQFNTKPRSSIIEIDKTRINPKTPAKRMVTPGVHEFAMWKPGYETWWKSLDIKAGSLTWLDYARLVPKEREAVAVQDYERIDQSLFSPGGSYVAIWPDNSLPNFDILDLRRSDDIKTIQVALETESLANYDIDTAGHNFTVDEWSQGGRYILVTHRSGDQVDWLMVDRDKPEEVVNISSLSGLAIDDVQLSGSDGKTAYILSDGTIRRIDLGSGELSRSLASRVDNFSLYATDIITYVGRTKDDSHQRVVGLIRSDEAQPYILKTIQAGQDVAINVDTARYFSQNYVAISINGAVEIYSGDYPTNKSRDEVKAHESSLQLIASYKTDQPVQWLEFSGNGRFIIAQNERGFISYDLERKQTSDFINFATNVDRKMRWLDSYYLWTVESEQLIMQEFDGTNRHAISPASAGYDVSFDQSGEYLYSLVRAETGVSLQRTLMVLP